MVVSAFGMMFPLGDPPDYEPAPEKSIAAIAAREGRDRLDLDPPVRGKLAEGEVESNTRCRSPAVHFRDDAVLRDANARQAAREAHEAAASDCVHQR